MIITVERNDILKSDGTVYSSIKSWDFWQKRIGLEMTGKMRYTDRRILQMLVLSAITLRRILSWYQQEILEMV